MKHSAGTFKNYSVKVPNPNKHVMDQIPEAFYESSNDEQSELPDGSHDEEGNHF